MLLGDRELTPPELKAFTRALTKAFDLVTFDTMLLTTFGWRHEDKTNADGFENIVPRIILVMQQDNKTQELLLAALAVHPENQHLLEFARSFGIMTPTSSAISEALSAQLLSDGITQLPLNSLERKIREIDSDYNPAQLRACLERLEKQICKISITSGRREISGTAFLLYMDIIMTNYHVVKDVIDGPIPPDKVTLFFDYKLEADAKTVYMGTPYKLAKDWLIDHSPNCDADFQITAHPVDVEEKFLDYALLRLAKKVGDERLEGNIRRGWIPLPETEYEFRHGSSLFILHHPNGDPLKLTLDTHSVLEVNSNKTRVRYSTSTENGSSGAPCFNSDWELVAIHQSGDPDFSRDAQYNQGIPITTILRRLERLGKKRLLVSKRIGKEDKQDVLNPVLLHVQFLPPESEMSVETRALLSTLVQRMETLKPLFPQPQKRKSQLQFHLKVDQLEHITGALHEEQLHLLLLDYVCLELAIAKRAQRPFNTHADIQPIHFKETINALDLIEDCLRKICALLNNSSHLLKKISLEIVSQLTVEADAIIENINDFRHYLLEEKDSYPYNARIHSNIREKFAQTLNDLNRFQRRFTEKDDQLPEQK